MPKFSIVIPTRNRAHLLKFALQSALDQTFGDDYEIVVCDNDSSDDTPRVVRKFGNGRVRYFRTTRTLSMPDNWEFALEKATGEWVTYLQDRAVISRKLLEIIAAALEKKPVPLISWTGASYISDSWYDERHHNQLVILPFRGNTVVMDSKKILSGLFSKFYAHNSQPVMLNSFCHRELIHSIQKQSGRFFHPVCPDYSACIAMLALTDEYTYVDLPLRVHAQTKESTGGSQSHNRGEASRKFLREFGNEPLLRHVPLKALVMDNFITESILRVQEKMIEQLKDYQLNWQHYFVRCYTQLQHLSSQGVEVSSEMSDFYQTLNAKPLRFRWEVLGSIFSKGLPFYVKRVQARRLIDRFPVLVKLDRLIRKTPAPHAVVRGNEAGFTDCLGALSCLENVLATHLHPG